MRFLAKFIAVAAITAAHQAITGSSMDDSTFLAVLAMLVALDVIDACIPSKARQRGK